MGRKAAPTIIAAVFALALASGRRGGRGSRRGHLDTSGPDKLTGNGPATEPSTGICREGDAWGQYAPDGCAIFWNDETTVAFVEAFTDLATERQLKPCEMLDDGNWARVTVPEGLFETAEIEVWAAPPDLVAATAQALARIYEVPPEAFARQIDGTPVWIGANSQHAAAAWPETPPPWTAKAFELAWRAWVYVYCGYEPET